MNEAPAAVALVNAVASIDENTATASHIKVADIAVTDDALGTNTLGLTGADAASFEIEGTSLYLKAGTVLDFETKASYAVAVTVDDATVGATPDATSTTYTLTVADVGEPPIAPPRHCGRERQYAGHRCRARAAAVFGGDHRSGRERR